MIRMLLESADSRSASCGCSRQRAQRRHRGRRRRARSTRFARRRPTRSRASTSRCSAPAATPPRRSRPEAAKRGATVIDNSSAWRMEPGRPARREPGQSGRPRAATRASSPTRTARRCSSCRCSWRCATRSASSGSWSTRTRPSAAPAARRSPSSQAQIEAHVARPARSRRPSTRTRSRSTPCPQIDVFLDNGYTKEEWKVVTESRKILHLPDLRISCTAVRVPVFVAHSRGRPRRDARPDHARTGRATLFAAVPGVVVQDDPSTIDLSARDRRPPAPTRSSSGGSARTRRSMAGAASRSGS